ncbi:SecY-interacting protein [Pseudoalteromonas tunicata]|jgi:SecY interacting protein Syd|uniref:Protein Syd n=1 Tax=Pseudoalteromonas tunicata D2 TaxID=87626 RepID=A4C5J8_9GAMM|nr:SecY-interacting protein [Pseudoalteromonas tunicata]ATC95227.1 SecY interacting protein Syd [Pseudoalteromonas tunicata]AXT30834.1 SecY-interacting protein [Pseudoalteromonas tunicata]EAR29252.1 SecY interacting protein Syd [Pseudoalteromonas tunicata D2]MDP4982345.1 SecY-interacting protein [Pseudoalteromonas tunicata]MDP5213178.1 SecY-interacting protein [Pseudoalteromonas tunicata]
MAVQQVLKQLLNQWHEKAVNHTGSEPLIEHDEQWPSPCENMSSLNEGLVQWQHVERTEQGDLTQLADALELTFHPSINAFYGAFYSNNVPVTSHFGQFELLQAWNEDDFERLQQNITGHILMKRKLKQPPTIFIGLTEEEDLLLTLDCTSGDVCLEYVGKKPHKVLTHDLAEFLEYCTAEYRY